MQNHSFAIETSLIKFSSKRFETKLQLNSKHCEFMIKAHIRSVKISGALC